MTTYKISRPQVINVTPLLIALPADLQSTVIYDASGQEVAWIHAHKKAINLISDQWAVSNILSKIWAAYTCSLCDRATINWGIKTSFIYPNEPLSVPTIATEDRY